MKTLQGSVRVAMVVGAIVLIAGALGFIIGMASSGDQQLSNQTDTTSETDSKDNKTEAAEAELEIAEDTKVSQGTIIGSLTYPSEVIPPEMQIFAENIETGEVFSTQNQLRDSRYMYGVGYNITAPVGEYYVYGVLPTTMPDQRAYYNKAAECIRAGAPWGTCENRYEKLVVTVESNAETKDATIGDWTATCVVPGGAQPTKKFDLPTC